jgi:hypothetical protein
MFIGGNSAASQGDAWLLFSFSKLIRANSASFSRILWLFQPDEGQNEPGSVDAEDTSL